MGRRTWESIPERFRPLKGRVNVVLSSKASEEGKRNGVVWCTGLEEAMGVLRSMALGTGEDVAMENYDDDGGGEEGPVKVGRVFVIGGHAVYKAALERPETKRILLTRIYGDWDCDVFFPMDIEHEKGWERKELQDFRDWVGEEVPKGKVKDGDVEFEYCMFERN
jgi:dihydrofolate reductase